MSIENQKPLVATSRTMNEEQGKEISQIDIWPVPEGERSERPTVNEHD